MGAFPECTQKGLTVLVTGAYAGRPWLVGGELTGPGKSRGG